MVGGGVRLVYTVAEAAALLGVGRSTAYDLIGRGELRVLRLGRRLFVPRPVLTELLGCEPPLPHELTGDHQSYHDVDHGDQHASSRRLRSVVPVESA